MQLRTRQTKTALRERQCVLTVCPSIHSETEIVTPSHLIAKEGRESLAPKISFSPRQKSHPCEYLFVGTVMIGCPTGCSISRALLSQSSDRGGLKGRFSSNWKRGANILGIRGLRTVGCRPNSDRSPSSPGWKHQQSFIALRPKTKGGADNLGIFATGDFQNEARRRALRIPQKDAIRLCRKRTYNHQRRQPDVGFTSVGRRMNELDLYLD